MLRIAAAFALLAASLPAAAQDLSEDVAARAVDIWSEGTRMAGYVYTPKSVAAGERLPTVVMAHGWGGTQRGLRRNAIGLAQHGYLVLTFDYRGWGESDSRVIL
ncbi:MAG: hypothetical protein R3190_17520, partial [Thermoanaerobaculia bacterium]|nr:hypothetical protein [Thermoanaerobaculia bacterium]